MCALFRKIGVRVIDSLLKEAAAGHPIDDWRNQARYTMALRDLNKRLGVRGDTVSQESLAGNPEYFSGLKAAYDEHLGGLGSSAAERAPKVVSVAK